MSLSRLNTVDSCEMPRRHQKAVWLGFKGKDTTSWEAKSCGKEGKKRCLWSLSKWGAFARLGKGGENECEASCEADRHTCRWIIWQPGQVLHHCRIHVHHLHLLRCKSVDSVQPLVLLERTEADLKRCFKDKTGVLWWHCCVFRSCLKERIAAS